MDSPIIIIMLAIGVLVLAGLIIAAVAWKKRRGLNAEKTDYRAFFIMGVVMVPLGIIGIVVTFATDIPFVVALPLLTIGLVYMALGLGNRATWGQR